MCFPVNFEKFLRTPFLQNISGRLLLWLLKYWNFLFKNVIYLQQSYGIVTRKYMLILILMLFDLLLYYLGYCCQHFSLSKWLGKGENNAMMESKSYEIKNVFIAETKEILVSSIKEDR